MSQYVDALDVWGPAVLKNLMVMIEGECGPVRISRVYGKGEKAKIRVQLDRDESFRTVPITSIVRTFRSYIF